MNKIAVYGSGYVGLVTAACLAEVDFSVICVDIDSDRVQQLQALDLGAIAADDSELSDLVRAGVESGRLQFTTDAAEADAPAAFICVGTPAQMSGEADLRAVQQVARDIARFARQNTVIFVKSTVPPGTCEKLQQRLQRQLASRLRTGKDLSIEVVSNPEFLRQGTATNDFRRPDRVMFGVSSAKGEQAARDIYNRLPHCRDRLMFADLASAELAKYAANAFLAARVALINDFALLADQVGADIEAVRRCIGADHRIGSEFLLPGCGFGGSCFGKDLLALEHLAGNSLESDIFRSILSGNEQHQLYPLDLAREYLGDSLKGLRAAIWGLTFKAGTADTRDASAGLMIDELLASGATVAAYDPLLNEVAAEEVELAADPLAAAESADMLIICTASAEFAEVDLAALHGKMRRPFVIDSHNLLEREQLREQLKALGFEYRGMGRRI